MPEALTGILYGVGVILVLSRFLGGQDLGILKIPALSTKKSMRAMISGIILICALLAVENRTKVIGFVKDEVSASTLRFTPDEKTVISLPNGEILEGVMERRVYAQHDYIYIRFSGDARMQLYKLRPKPIGSNNQGCKIELIAYSEVPPTADVEIDCPR